ncbi:hypothetical protein ACFYNY_34420 [Streptomyces sp. NPDC006530]|uniref:hypothetical protein n=1 Tax=Streptomyces sp. NPDC006530 TaxID=3364750 RepID=UPI0036BF454A
MSIRTTARSSFVGDQTLYHPWGAVSPSFWGSAAVAELTSSSAPAESASVKDKIAAIGAVYAAQGPVPASILAEQLDAETVAACGEAHLYVAEIREVRGYLAHLAGDHRSAVGWYLHVVHMRAGLQGPQHPDTLGASRRAYSLWRNVPDADSIALGVELLATVTAVHGAEAEVSRHTRDHLAASANQAVPEH